MTWTWKLLDEHAPHELHSILAARTAVFVVEQKCPFQDPDELDLGAWHLTAWGPDGRVAAYLRVLAPGAHFAEVSLGRVLTTAAFRGTGLGRALMSEGLRRISEVYGNQAVRISAQKYLERFYGSFGFAAVSEVYLLDDILHVDMRRPAT